MERFTKWIGILLTALTMAIPAGATVWNVNVANFQFTPASITIAQGDTVRWNATSGTHNVRELHPTPVFLSGNPASAPWTYQFVFAGIAPGAYNYHCDPHAPGMAGTVTVQAPNSAPEPPTARMNLSLEQNYPNPFNSATSIAFTLPAEAHVNLSVMNVLGQTVANLYDGDMEHGAHQFLFDASGLTSGMYYYKLLTPYGAVARKMFYMK